MPEPDIDATILDAIKRYHGCPSFSALGKICGIEHWAVSGRAKANPEIASAIEEKWGEYERRMTPEEAVAKMPEEGWFTNLPEHIKEAVLRKIDAVLLSAVDGCADVPNASKLEKATHISDSIILKRIRANRRLAEAIERKGIEIISGMGQEEFIRKICEIGWLPAIPGKAREAAEERYDAILLEAVRSYAGVPTLPQIAAAVGIHSVTITKRVAEKDPIWEEMERKGREYLAGLDDRQLIEEVNRVGLDGVTFPPYAKDIIFERMRGMVKKAVLECEGFPTIPAIAKAVGISAHLVKERIGEEPSIKDEMEKKGMLFLEGISDAHLIVKRAESGWLTNLPERAKVAVNARVDRVILEGVGRCKGRFSISALEKETGMPAMFLLKRMGENAELAEAVEARRVEEAARRGAAIAAAGGAEPAGRKAVPASAKREALLATVKSYKGIPSIRKLGAASGIDDGAVDKLLKDDAEIAREFERAGREYLASLTDEEFAEMVSGAFVTGKSKFVDVYRDRLDRMILEAVRSSGPIFIGTNDVAIISGINWQPVSGRIKANPAIREAIDSKNEAYLLGLSDDEFMEGITLGKLPQRVDGHRREVMYERLDKIIIKVSREFDGMPTSNSVAGALGVGTHAIINRKEANPKIEEAMRARAKEYLAGLGDEEFMEKFSKTGWVANTPEYVKGPVIERFYSIVTKAIEEYEGIPTFRVIARIVGITVSPLARRIEERQKILENMEKRGRDYLAGLSDQEIVGILRNGGWTVSTYPDYAKEIIEARFRALILREIGAFEGVPTASGLSRVVGIGYTSIKSRLDADSSLREAMERRGREYLQRIEEEGGIESLLEGEEAGELPDYALDMLEKDSRLASAKGRRLEAAREKLVEIRKAREAEIDHRILDAIISCGGLPKIEALHEMLPDISGEKIGERINANAELSAARNEKAKEFLSGFSDEQFLKEMREGRWNSMDYVKKEADARVEWIILKAIIEYNGVPTAVGISRVLSDYKGVIDRMEASETLKAALVERTREYLFGLDQGEFMRTVTKTGWAGGQPEYVTQAVNERMLKIIEEAIPGYEGVPTIWGIGKKIGTGFRSVEDRINANPSLLEKMEKRGREYLEGLSDEKLLGLLQKNTLSGSLPEYSKQIIEKRVDAILWAALEAYEGVPTVNALGKAAGVGEKRVMSILARDGKFKEAMGRKGLGYINGLGEGELFEMVSEPGKVAQLPDYAKAEMNGRIDRIIIREIGRIGPSVTKGKLAAAMGCTDGFITKRISLNPEVWAAFYEMRGLTRDQAIELSLERGAETPSSEQVIRNRLPHLYAFREMGGIIRCFGDLLKGKILEVSLYPNPLGKAAEELGMQLDVVHRAMRPVREGEKITFEKASVAVLQGLHRLSSEGITRLFRLVGDALDAGQQVVATYSTRYAQVEGFVEALQRNGFQLEEAGVMRIDAPSRETLLSYGAKREDLERIARKMEGESRVLVLRKMDGASDVEVPALQKLPNGEGEKTLSGDAEAVDTPKGIVREISAKFLEDAVILPSSKFLVEIEHGEQTVALVGYDMDPRVKNKVETEVLTGAPQADYRAIARKMASSIAERRRLGIRPDAITRVPLRKIIP